MRFRVVALIRSCGSLLATREMVAGWTPARAASSFSVANWSSGERSRARRTCYPRNPVDHLRAEAGEDHLTGGPRPVLPREIGAHVPTARLLSDQRRLQD